MFKQKEYNTTSIAINASLQGETIEQKMERVTQNKEPIKDGAPLIYTDRNDGVQAGYNIRTDRFEIAVDAMDRVAKSKTAQRDNVANMKIVHNDISGAESTQGNGTE